MGDWFHVNRAERPTKMKIHATERVAPAPAAPLIIILIVIWSGLPGRSRGDCCFSGNEMQSENWKRGMP